MSKVFISMTGYRGSRKRERKNIKRILLLLIFKVAIRQFFVSGLISFLAKSLFYSWLTPWGVSANKDSKFSFHPSQYRVRTKTTTNEQLKLRKSKYPLEESAVTRESHRQWRSIWQKGERQDCGRELQPAERENIYSYLHKAHPVLPLFLSIWPLILKYWFCHLLHWPLKP